VVSSAGWSQDVQLFEAKRLRQHGSGLKQCDSMRWFADETRYSQQLWLLANNAETKE